MFWNIYKYRLISTFRNPMTLIWTWGFPIILATLFHFTFASLDSANQFHQIPVCVVEDNEFTADTTFQSTIQALSEDGENSMFKTGYVSKEEADKRLKNSEIDGYFQIIDGTPALYVKEDGLNQTIMKCFLDQYIQTKSSIETLILKNPENASVIESVLNSKTITESISLTENPQTDVINYFYALLSMVCMYGGFQGLISISYLQANLSALGARRTASSAKRYQLIVYDLLGGVTSQFLCLLVLTAYIRFVLGVSFGSNAGFVILTCLAGSITGVAFGALVSVSAKLKENSKIAVIVSVTMVLSFLSGLMVTGINYMIMKTAPVIGWLNPAARITDAFYCLYYYDNYKRYFINIGILLIMSALMFGLTTIFIRRQRYESI